VANYVAKWNGASWSDSGDDQHTRVYALAWDSTNNLLYAGGDFTIATGSVANYIAKWNASSWSAMEGDPGDGVRALAFDASGLCMPVDISEFSNGVAVRGLRRNRHKRWRVFSLAFDSSTLYVGGEFPQPEAARPTPLPNGIVQTQPGQQWELA
jgi:hypothetical protein